MPVPKHPEGELWGFLMKGFVHAELSESDSERKMSKGTLVKKKKKPKTLQRNILIEDSFKAKDAKQIRRNHQETTMNRVLFPKVEMNICFLFYQAASEREL